MDTVGSELVQHLQFEHLDEMVPKKVSQPIDPFCEKTSRYTALDRRKEPPNP